MVHRPRPLPSLRSCSRSLSRWGENRRMEKKYATDISREKLEEIVLLQSVRRHTKTTVDLCQVFCALL